MRTLTSVSGIAVAEVLIVMRVEVTVVNGRRAPGIVELEAPDLMAARDQAARLGYTVLSDRVIEGRLGARASSWLGKSDRIDVVVFVEQLRDLLVAGLSVIEALDALARGAHGEAGGVIERLERSLRTGQTLAGSLAQQDVFPSLLVALVRSAELTSDLPATLSRFLEHESRVTEVRHRLVAASIYPLLLTGVGVLVLFFLCLYVMPRFARIFEGMTGELPWSAQAMVSWSHILRDHGILVSVGLAIAAIAVGSIIASSAARAGVAAMVLAWAPLRRRLNAYFLARWYRTTGMLVQGGIPLADALPLSNGLLPAMLRPAGKQVEQGIRSGLSPSQAHVRAGMATPVAEQLLLAGERTGDLGSVLTRIAQFHESEVSRALERTMRAVEPLVMVAIGLGVGVVVVLMYLPVFELASAIQ